MRYGILYSTSELGAKTFLSVYSSREDAVREVKRRIKSFGNNDNGIFNKDATFWMLNKADREEGIRIIEIPDWAKKAVFWSDFSLYETEGHFFSDIDDAAPFAEGLIFGKGLDRNMDGGFGKDKTEEPLSLYFVDRNLWVGEGGFFRVLVMDVEEPS